MFNGDRGVSSTCTVRALKKAGAFTIYKCSALSIYSGQLKISRGKLLALGVEPSKCLTNTLKMIWIARKFPTQKQFDTINDELERNGLKRLSGPVRDPAKIKRMYKARQTQHVSNLESIQRDRPLKPPGRVT